MRSLPPFARILLRILGLAFAHFAVSLLFAMMAEGMDLDQLRSRSALSQAAGEVYDVLFYPHDAFLRAMPNRWLVEVPGYIPAVLVGHSLLWGVVLYGVWLALRGPRGSSGRTFDQREIHEPGAMDGG